MNNKTKGWVAAALGGALLLGTGGTFALWSDTAGFGEAASITTGNLALGEVLSVDWVWSHVSYSDTDSRSDRPEEGDPVKGGSVLVPGDAITGTLNMEDITLTGSTLVANLYLDGVQVSVNNEGYVVHEGEATPLVFLVNNVPVTSSSDRIVLAKGLTATNKTVSTVSATLGFPVDRETGVEPGVSGDDGGRNLSGVTLETIELRLEQEVLDSAFRPIP